MMFSDCPGKQGKRGAGGSTVGALVRSLPGKIILPGQPRISPKRF
jgi:hypothetical protein